MKERTVLITGGNGGLGSACIEYLKDKGWNTISIDIYENKEIPSDLFIQADVVNADQVKKGFDTIEGKFSSIDALVCLAGIVFDAPLVGISKGSIETYDHENWFNTINVNLTGTFLCSREFAFRNIKKRNKGVIVTCSSPAAEGSPGQSAYSASKAGVEAFTKSIARELFAYGIRACCIRPGLVKTPMAELYSQSILKNLVNKSLLRRFVDAKEFAEAVHFLLNSDLPIGRVLELDGGINL